MQRLFVIMLLVSVFSCKSKTVDPAAQGAEYWQLMEKNVYEYKFNSSGKPDTTFISTLKYKDGVITDTAIAFVISKFNGDWLEEEHTYMVGKDKVVLPRTVTKYVKDKFGKAAGTVVSIGNNTVREQRFIFNDSNLLIKSLVIQMKPYNILTGGSLDLSSATKQSIGFDTLINIFQYDQTKKVVGTTFTDGSGKILSREVNVYSGNDPLLSFAVSEKGDTLKKITYEKEGKILRTVTENDSLTLFQNFMNGIEVAQKTKYKKRNEQWRSATKFDQNGRKIEEVLYKLTSSPGQGR